MEKYTLPLGSKVEVSRNVKLKNGEESPVLTSKVMDIIDDKTIVIAIPMNKMVNVPLSMNEEVDLFFYTNTIMLSVSARVKERFYDGKFPVLKMVFTRPLKKFQRRQFFRIECHIPFRFAVLQEEQSKSLLEFKGTDKFTKIKLQEHVEELEETIVEWSDGIIVDLSGGGIRFITEKGLTRGDIILVSLSLQSGEEIEKITIVSRLISVEDKKEVQGKKEVRASFYKLKDTLRDSIVKFVFDEERRIRKKSL